MRFFLSNVLQRLLLIVNFSVNSINVSRKTRLLQDVNNFFHEQNVLEGWQTSISTIFLSIHEKTAFNALHLQLHTSTELYSLLFHDSSFNSLKLRNVH